MNARERFRETMRFGTPDRVPYFEEGVREEVLKVWQTQGLPAGADFSQMFPSDRREEIQLELEPIPKPKPWPTSLNELDALRKSLDPKEPRRWPDDWNERVKGWQERDHLLMFRVHRGFFLTMGVHDWDRFADVVELTVESPDFVREAMRIQGEFAAELVEKVLDEVEIDAAVFSEPIGGNDRPLISPRMYEDLVLDSYEPVLWVLRKHGIETIVFRTFANSRILIPNVLNRGFNCLWACEVKDEAMDYRDIRRDFGRDLRLIGGIDLDALRAGKEAIRAEIEEKVPPLLAEGGYVPLADGRVREDVPFENYRYYRELLEAATGGT
ncbi:MAG: uroporphyrinogen decarboxylase family protein [Planctomycetota bacterium]|jgi:uroporphyrinogen decarboxylase